MAWGKNICIHIGTWIEDAGERDCTCTFRSYIYIYTFTCTKEDGSECFHLFLSHFLWKKLACKF